MVLKTARQILIGFDVTIANKDAWHQQLPKRVCRKEPAGVSTHMPHQFTANFELR